MKRCVTPQMSLLPAKCSGGLTALKTNTSTAQATAEQRLYTHTGPGTGMEVRSSGFKNKMGLDSNTKQITWSHKPGHLDIETLRIFYFTI